GWQVQRERGRHPIRLLLERGRQPHLTCGRRAPKGAARLAADGDRLRNVVGRPQGPEWEGHLYGRNFGRQHRGRRMRRVATGRVTLQWNLSMSMLPRIERQKPSNPRMHTQNSYLFEGI